MKLFLGKDHKELFLAAMREANRLHDGERIDQEYGSAIYLLTSEFWMWESMRPYFLVNGTHGIDFESYLRKIPTSSGEGVLINAAWNLFNSGGEAPLIELMRLDEKNFQLVLNALQIRHRQMKVSEVE